MSVDQATIRTGRGDELLVTLFDHAGEPPSILISVLDADDHAVPTAELTIVEAADLREVLRKFCEATVRAGHTYGR